MFQGMDARGALIGRLVRDGRALAGVCGPRRSGASAALVPWQQHRTKARPATSPQRSGPAHSYLPPSHKHTQQSPHSRLHLHLQDSRSLILLQFADLSLRVELQWLRSPASTLTTTSSSPHLPLHFIHAQRTICTIICLLRLLGWASHPPLRHLKAARASTTYLQVLTTSRMSLTML